MMAIWLDFANLSQKLFLKRGPVAHIMKNISNFEIFHALATLWYSSCTRVRSFDSLFLLYRHTYLSWQELHYFFYLFFSCAAQLPSEYRVGEVSPKM